VGVQVATDEAPAVQEDEGGSGMAGVVDADGDAGDVLVGGCDVRSLGVADRDAGAHSLAGPLGCAPCEGGPEAGLEPDHAVGVEVDGVPAGVHGRRAEQAAFGPGRQPEGGEEEGAAGAQQRGRGEQGDSWPFGDGWVGGPGGRCE
jgi:hypothetical protein